MKEFRELMTEAVAKRLDDKQLINSIQKLIDKKVIRVEKDGQIFKIKWDENPSSIFLTKNPKSIPKKWQDGLIDIVNDKGFGITVWDGIPKQLRAAIEAANKERRMRRFDKETVLINKNREKFGATNPKPVIGGGN